MGFLSWLTGRKKSANSTPAHVAPPPIGRPIRPWSGGPYTELEVAGEAYRQEAFDRIFRNVSGFRAEGGTEIRPDAVLVADFANPHSEHGRAVSVWIEGEHVGYLASHDSETWSPVVRHLLEQGCVLVLRARAWASKKPSGRTNARVTLYVPDPNDVFPVNNVPEIPHIVLPPGPAIQVMREEDHMDVLLPLLADRPTPVAVTLHMVTEQRPRSSVNLVEVRVGGKRVGVLTPTSTSNLEPLINLIESRGKVAVARAKLQGNELKVQLTLNVERASNVGQAWLVAVSQQ